MTEAGKKIQTSAPHFAGFDEHEQGTDRDIPLPPYFRDLQVRFTFLTIDAIRLPFTHSQVRVRQTDGDRARQLEEAIVDDHLFFAPLPMSSDSSRPSQGARPASDMAFCLSGMQKTHTPARRVIVRNWKIHLMSMDQSYSSLAPEVCPKPWPCTCDSRLPEQAVQASERESSLMLEAGLHPFPLCCSSFASSQLKQKPATPDDVMDRETSSLEERSARL